MTIDVDDSHGDMVLRVSNGESPPEEWPLRGRTMLPVSLLSRRRERKLRKVARLLDALDSASGAQRAPVRERRRVSLGRAA
jgi:hypothetical protein